MKKGAKARVFAKNRRKSHQSDSDIQQAMSLFCHRQPPRPDSRPKSDSLLGAALLGTVRTIRGDSKIVIEDHSSRTRSEFVQRSGAPIVMGSAFSMFKRDTDIRIFTGIRTGTKC